MCWLQSRRTDNRANSDNMKDFEALTPNYFLIGRHFCNNKYLGETRTNNLCSEKRWRQVKLLTQLFWSHWLNYYLPTLIRRVKQHSDYPNIKFGQVVLFILVVMVQYVLLMCKPKKGVYRRPVVKTDPLEEQTFDEVLQCYRKKLRIQRIKYAITGLCDLKMVIPNKKLKL